MSGSAESSTASPTLPENYDLSMVYSTFQQADTAVSNLGARVDQQARNQVRLSNRVTSLESRMLDVERDRIVGTLKIEGARVPQVRRRERLFPILRDLLWDNFRIKLHPLDINLLERLNFGKKAPIVARFTGSHTSTVFFALTDPKLRILMKERKIFLNRLQTPTDIDITRLCSKLRRAGLIAGQLVDKWHLTNVMPLDGSPPVPITGEEDFVEVFSPTVMVQVQGIIHDHKESLKPLGSSPPAAVVEPAVSGPAESAPAMIEPAAHDTANPQEATVDRPPVADNVAQEIIEVEMVSATGSNIIDA